MRRGVGQERVPVRPRLGDDAGADAARPARAVLDHEGLAQDLAHRADQHAHRGVRAATRGVRDHQADGPVREGLGQRRRGEGFTLADIPLGLVVNRWYAVRGFDKPDLPAVAAYFERLSGRPAFLRHGRNGLP